MASWLWGLHHWDLADQRTVDYILNQEKHHGKRSFVQEWKIFLKRHELVEYEE